jgi:AcrR family transcriptional regulator
VVDRRIQRGQATRAALISAARVLFGERGYEGTSIEAVLEGTGVARGALYHHFSTKEALFDAVLDSVVAEIAQGSAQAARAAGTDPVAQLRAGCGAWLQMALDPAIQRIALLDPPAVVGWTRWRELDERYVLRGLKVSLERIRPSSEVDVLAHMLLAAVSEAALLIARAPDPIAAKKASEQALDALIRGLASQEGP